MKAIFRLFGLPAMLALLVMLPASAQTTPATLPYGYTIELPAGWAFSDLQTRVNATVFSKAHTHLTLLTPPQVSAIYPEADSADLWDVLTELHLRMYDGVMGVGIADAWPARYEDSPALMYSYAYEYEGRAYRGQTLVIDWPQAGGLVFADLVAPDDEFLDAANDLPTFILTLKAAPVTTVALADGYAADLPHGWQVVDSAGNPRAGTTLLRNGDVQMILLTTPQITALVPDAGTSERIWDTFGALHLALHDGLGGDGQNVVIGQDNGRMVLRYGYDFYLEPNQLQRNFSLFYPFWGADGMVFVEAEGPIAQVDALAAQVEAIALSVRQEP